MFLFLQDFLTIDFFNAAWFFTMEPLKNNVFIFVITLVIIYIMKSKVSFL